jgi:hypothetical protein
VPDRIVKEKRGDRQAAPPTRGAARRA